MPQHDTPKPRDERRLDASAVLRCLSMTRARRAEIARLLRLDKFMKVSRLSKRRSEAHEALVHGRITKDGKELKPGYQVKPGDVLEIHYATKFVTVRIREVPLRMTPGLKPADLYEILDQRKDEPSEWL
jgi:ribosomal 50S subunit-recycling heat shock protein